MNLGRQKEVQNRHLTALKPLTKKKQFENPSMNAPRMYSQYIQLTRKEWVKCVWKTNDEKTKKQLFEPV